MHKLHHLTILALLALLMILFFSTQAVGPNYNTDLGHFSTPDPALDGVASNGRSISDSLALLTSGLIMLISASFLRRLSG